MTRPSAIDKSSNQWVISAQLDEATYKRLEHLCQVTGMSRSRMIKVLIAGARPNPKVTRTAAKQKHE